MKAQVLCTLLAAASVWPATVEAQTPRRVAFTFDDLPAQSVNPATAEYRAVTRRLVSALVRHGVPAIGFVNENKLEIEGAVSAERVALLETWLQAGLELGNHSYAHRDLHDIPLDAYQRDVLLGERITRPLVERHDGRLRFYRHPFLHTGREVEQRAAFEAFLGVHGYRVAPVTIDNSEWIFSRAYDRATADGDAARAARLLDAYIPYMERVFAYYEALSVDVLGYEVPQVLLLHANRINADALDRLIAMVRSRGYEIVPLDQALADPAYGRPDGYTGPMGLSWLHRWAMADDPTYRPAAEPPVPDVVNEAASGAVD